MYMLTRFPYEKKETFLKAKVKVNFKIKPKSPLAKTYKYSKTPRHNYPFNVN